MAEAGPVLVLIGPMGAGKTRIGKRVARLLEVPFIDTDKRIVAEHGAIADIFAEHGEPRFRELEREQVAKALGEHGVISLGGGAVLDADTQSDLVPLRVGLMTITAEAVAPRIAGETKRPLVADGIESWIRLHDQRRDLYDRLADRTFDTSTLPAEKIAHDIADWVREGTT